jgi:hypothetical protein
MGNGLAPARPFIEDAVDGDSRGDGFQVWNSGGCGARRGDGSKELPAHAPVLRRTLIVLDTVVCGRGRVARPMEVIDVPSACAIRWDRGEGLMRGASPPGCESLRGEKKNDPSACWRILSSWLNHIVCTVSSKKGDAWQTSRCLMCASGPLEEQSGEARARTSRLLFAVGWFCAQADTRQGARFQTTLISRVELAV